MGQALLPAETLGNQVDQLLSRVTRYASGLSRANDFVAAAWSGHDVGVEIGELSPAAVTELARVIVDYGTGAFADSGAFGRYMRTMRSGLPPPAIDFGAVFEGYDRLSTAIAAYNEAEEPIRPVLQVMPDVVGDQDASLALIGKHRRDVQTTIAFRGLSRAIIPLHRGRLPLTDVHRHLEDLLGSSDWIAGIPSNAAAVGPSEFTRFLREAKPRSVHILGALADSRLRPRMAQIIASGQSGAIEITADANPLRSVVIEKGQGRAGRRVALQDQMGRRRRRSELVGVINRAGGFHAFRTAYTRASALERQQTVRLLTDLTGDPPAIAIGQFALHAPLCLRQAPPYLEILP